MPLDGWMHSWCLVVSMKLGISVAIVLVACGRADPPPPPPPVLPPPAVRGAAGDVDLRVMVAELASTKACDMIEGKFIGLPAANRPDVISGVLWIRHCKISNDGTRVGFELAGNGWQWVDQTKHEAGGTFSVRQYVKFGLDAKLRGTLDIAFDRGDHVLSLWFSPTEQPSVEFHPVGDIDVDRKGLWSSAIGGLSSVFADSPEEKTAAEATKQGDRQFATRLAGGITFAIDLCTGYQRSTLGRSQKGSLGKPGVGQTQHVAVELEPGGLMVFGPQHAKGGMTVDIDSDGPVRVGLACVTGANAAAEAFVGDGPPPLVPTLGQQDVNGHGRIRIKPTSCEVAVVVRSISPKLVSFDWRRPADEQARASGGPVIRCAH